MLNADPELDALTLLFAFASLLPIASAVFINFDNCQPNPPVIVGTAQSYLHFTPLFVWASFDTLNPTHNLNVTVYGDVAGQADEGSYPPPGADNWNDPNSTFGKIVDIDQGNNKFTTVLSDFKVLTYEAWRRAPAEFCTMLINGTCPLKPTFSNVTNDPYIFPAITLSHDFYSSYSFATWATNIQIISGNRQAQTLGCISATITPDLGQSLSNALRYMPAAILVLVAIATVFAATCCPWGTSNIYRWTSNYGRDEDVLRLVTPGFGDCLQYIQFIVLAGSLSLNYPGYFQPVISKASWSVLLFNQSFVSQGNGSQSLIDGIYMVNGTYGLTRLGEYVGTTLERDIWACMAVFLLVIIGAVILLIQLGFFARWFSRSIKQNQSGDLTAKNWAFTAGNIVRIVFNYFLLPIVSLSLFQLVVSPRSTGSTIAPAVVLLVVVAGGATWIFWFIFTTRPRAHLFDDLPTVLTYGPLYNTYSDDAAPFAFIPVLLTVIRGIAIGAIQPSGIAQIVILAICEVILILTLHAFRPFQSNTSMNAYHTFFSAIRLTCILLSVSFVPSLGVGESAKGWIGYVILLLHAIVLVFGFFLNSLQTIVEVAARRGGAGGDRRGGLMTAFGKRQLSKRDNRHGRSSLNSNAAMLAHDENKNLQRMDSRSRSMSASSGILLNGPYDRESTRASTGFDQFSGDYNVGGTSPGTPGTTSAPFNFISGGSNHSSRRPTMGLATEDTYYRAPRARKHTMESVRPGAQGRPSVSTDNADTPYSDNVDVEGAHIVEGPPRDSGTPAPAYLRMNREDSDPNLERRNNTDYSVRESDFYYGLRGPALSSQTPRKLKTGPADPLSPVSSATGWFKNLNLLGGRKKEKSKGFEVVRSTRVPPQMMAVEEDNGESPEMPQEPYRDSPDTPPRNRQAQGVASASALRGGRRQSDSESNASDDDHARGHRVPTAAPTLGPIEMGGGIELPSRIGSRASRATQGSGPPSRTPTLPRKNSRRSGSTDAAMLTGRLSTVTDYSTPATPALAPPQHRQNQYTQSSGLPIRLPFGAADPTPSPERSPGHSAASSLYNEGTGDFNSPYAARAQNHPLSTGVVQHHMTKDSLQSDGVDAGNHLEASAEFVERSRSGSTQQSKQSRRSRR